VGVQTLLLLSMSIKTPVGIQLDLR
jgi:hypothetical protein